MLLFFKPNKKSMECQCEQIEKFVKKLGLKKWQVVQMPHEQMVLFYELEKNKVADMNEKVTDMKPSNSKNKKDSDFKF